MTKADKSPEYSIYPSLAEKLALRVDSSSLYYGFELPEFRVPVRSLR